MQDVAAHVISSPQLTWREMMGRFTPGMVRHGYNGGILRGGLCRGRVPTARTCRGPGLTCHDLSMRNVLGGELQECGTDPMTGFTRSGRCEVTSDDLGLHGVCAVMTEEFLQHQLGVGNDLVTPRPMWSFPGLRAGDRWCVVAVRWLQAQRAGCAAPVVLASTHESVLEVVPLTLLQQHAVDVPDDVSGLTQG